MGQAGHARDLGHAPDVAGRGGPLSGFDAPAVPGHGRRIRLAVTGVGVASVEHVADQRDVLFAVVPLRPGDRQPVLRIVRQAEAVVVGLDRVVALVGRAVGVGTVLPPAVNLSGARFAVFAGPFAPGPERNSCGGAQVAFVGGVDEHGPAVMLLPPRRAVEDADRDDPVALFDYVARLGVELAAGQDRDLPGTRFGEHPLEGPLCDGGFETVSVAAIARLRRIRAVTAFVIGFVQRDEAGEESRRGTARGDVRGAQPVGRKSADVGRALQNDAVLPLACGGYGGGDPRRGPAHDHHVAGVRAGLRLEGQQQEQAMQQEFHG